ncbi:RtcB family protein [Patescibacteria group bacterium]|nr:RtcB family protein [Patescibacteria group bacterium]
MNAELLSRLNRVDGAIWELPKTYRKKMRVPVRIVATEKLLKDMDDGAVEQGINVAHLPGIIGASWMMPDAHWGYGFPIGGVAAFDVKDGVISPGGIGFDINCGMRLLVTNLTDNDVRPKIESIVNELFEAIPTGVGRGGVVRLSPDELKEVMVKGAAWAIEKGMGWDEDIQHIEENGAIPGADPENVSDRAIKRGINQLGTLGGGNHYLEVQKVEKVFDKKVGEEMGITGEGQVVVMIHCGSRGFGHQVATDYLNTFEPAMKKYGIEVPDKQLACVPFSSPEGKRYFSAMACAANNAFCNRQVIAHKVREVFAHVFGRSARELGMDMVYDVAHNIAKIEEHPVKDLLGKSNGASKSQITNHKSPTRRVVVHRKGATRAFPGEPVIIGGSMETGSYLLVGTQGALEKTFGSTAHGSGRTMSRTKARKMVRGKELQERMKARGIYVKSASYSGLAEEAGFAYKDIVEVVKSVSLADISQPVASFKPIGNIKG